MQPKPFFYLLNVQLVQISGVAKFADGSMAEPEIPLVITILDENDNPPHFEFHSGNITEASEHGSARPFGNSFVLLEKKKKNCIFFSIPFHTFFSGIIYVIAFQHVHVSKKQGQMKCLSCWGSPQEPLSCRSRGRITTSREQLIHRSPTASSVRSQKARTCFGSMK